MRATIQAIALLGAIALTAIVSVILAAPANAKAIEYDRHAIYSVSGAPVATDAVHKVRTAKKAKHKQHHKARERIVAPSIIASTPLVDKARALIGKTAAQLGLPRSLWCADFIAKIAPEAARKVDNPRWARDYAVLPKTAGRVGDIVVLSRGRGGHIGVVSGFDRRGNPIIISGNHGRRVAESPYPKHRVIAYVSGG